MNVLFVIDKELDYDLDVATWVQLAKHIERYSVFFLASYRNNRIQFAELDNEVMYLKPVRIPFIKRLVLYHSQIRNFESVLDKCNPRVVLFYTGNLLLMRKAIRLRQARKYKLFLDIRSLPVGSKGIRNTIEEYILNRKLQVASRHFDGITYITDEMERFCVEIYHLPVHRSEIWASGVDVVHFRPNGTKKVGNEFRLIYHGAIAGNRGLQSVVRALTMTRTRDIRFTVLGKGNGVGEIRRLIETLNLRDKVQILDSVPHKDVPYYINQADAGIIPLPDWPGWNTSSPIKLFEYLACCKPVIVTKIPAHTNVLAGRDFAFWADCSTPEDITQAIEAAYARRNEFEELGQKARQFVIENYTWKEQAQRLEVFIAD